MNYKAFGGCYPAYFRVAKAWMASLKHFRDFLIYLPNFPFFNYSVHTAQIYLINFRKDKYKIVFFFQKTSYYSNFIFKFHGKVSVIYYSTPNFIMVWSLACITFLIPWPRHFIKYMYNFFFLAILHLLLGFIFNYKIKFEEIYFSAQ